jgi:hypothetical protein
VPDPSDLDAEESVLGAMLLDGRAVDAVRDLLEPTDFYRGSHGQIYRVALALRDASSPTDAVSLAAELEKLGQLKEVGGKERIHELAALVPAAGNARHYAKLVVDTAERRKQVQVARALEQAARNGGLSSDPQLVSKLESIVETALRARTRERATVVTVADVDRETVEWLWEKRLPRGKLVVLDGDPGLGKSTVTLDVAARLTRGARWPDGAAPCEPSDVILISAEDGIADTIRPRLEAAYADLRLVHVLSEVRDDDGTQRPVSIPGDLPEIEQIICDRHAALVVLDPLTAFLGAKVDTHKDADVRRALHLLAKVAERTGACILVVRHLTKEPGKKAIYRGGGSIGIIGAARVGFLIAQDPDDEQRRIFATIKANLSRAPDALAYKLEEDLQLGVAHVIWDGLVDYSADDLVSDRSDDSSALSDAEDFLVAQLAGGPRPTNDVKQAARLARISWRTVERAKSRVRVVSRKSGFGGGWELALEQCQDEDEDRLGGLREECSAKPKVEEDRQVDAYDGALPGLSSLDEEKAA